MRRDDADAPFDDGPTDAGDQDLSLPLEMYFAREPDEADASFEASVLDLVGRSASFAGRRERRFISLSRVVIAAGLVAVVGTAAVLDRVGLAPWNDPLAPAPLSSLVESAAAGNAQPMTKVAMARDAIENSLRDAAALSAAQVSLAALSPVSSPSSASTVRARTAKIPFETVEGVQAGPYLTAAEPDCPPCACPDSGSMIVFGDGFRVPGVPGSSSRNELVWPSLEGLASSVVMLDGLPSATPPAKLAPVWYDAAATPHADSRGPVLVPFQAGEAR